MALNYEQYLLVCLGEEAGELQQAVAKALRFGRFDSAPGVDYDNEQQLVKEYFDVITIVKMLQQCGGLMNISPNQAELFMSEKSKKVRKYADYSINRGCLHIPTQQGQLDPLKLDGYR